MGKLEIINAPMYLGGRVKLKKGQKRFVCELKIPVQSKPADNGGTGYKYITYGREVSEIYVNIIRKDNLEYLFKVGRYREITKEQFDSYKKYDKGPSLVYSYEMDT